MKENTRIKLQIIGFYGFMSIPLCILIFNIGSMTTQKVAWKLADHVTRGALRVERFCERDMRIGFTNYLNYTEQTMDKKYAFTPEGFQDFVKDRNDLIRQQNRYVILAQQVIDSYSDSGLLDK